MSTASASPVPSAADQRLVLRGIDWSAYRKISEALTGRHVRLTYDRGSLEFMTISPLHGSCRWLLGRFIGVLTEECGLPLRGFGDMTCDREDLERGLEPDDSFYIVNEPLVRGREHLDLTVDPPPDLTVEIDISRSSERRMGIYAALRVPEVWRFDGETLTAWRLGSDGRYSQAERSMYFPSIPLDEIAAFLRRRGEMDENALVRLFRQWVREQIAPEET